MPENVLVIEYEPRYAERARLALDSPLFSLTIARDGEEALRAIDAGPPSLIVLSSVLPKISATELIRQLRERPSLASTRILLTVSGYNGRSPVADAQKVGADDILPKPYVEGDLLAKVREILRIPEPAAAAAPAEPLQDKRKTTMAKPTDDVDKMLADTLAGMMPKRKADASQPAAAKQDSTPPSTAQPPKTRPDIDKVVSDTLSGLEKSTRRSTAGGSVPRPSTGDTPVPEVTPKPAAPVPSTPPVVPPAAPTVLQTPMVQVPTPAKEEEEEPNDGSRFGQYVLIEKIAAGGMAEVWKARMRGVEGFQKIVAIKKILPHLSDNQDFIEMFVDEAKLAAQLNHNNIIHIYDLGKIQSSYYIAMEYVDGHDLKTILQRAQENDQPLGTELALFIASKVAAALDYAHRRRDFDEKDLGLVHRDVSPQNVLISQEGDIKLCDFGIAKAASKASHTQTGALKGKLQYMSPEQAWGRSVDRRSDIFALAAVLFEMLTGRKLFSGDNELSILDQVREARVTSPSLWNDEITPEIEQVVMKALARDPEERYQTAGDMARDLDAVLYSFRPTPTSADLAIYMHRLWSAQPAMVAAQETVAPAPAPAPKKPAIVVAPAPIVIKPAPVAPTPVVSAPVVPEPAPVAPAPAAPVFAASEPEAPKKPKAALIAIAGGVIAIAAAAAFFFMPKGGDVPAPAAVQKAPVQANAVQQTPLAAAPQSGTAALTTAPLTGTAASTTGAIDPALVSQEVQKRLAAERAKLEAQARAQQPAAADVPASAQAQPPAQVAQAAPQVPAPVVEQERPAAPPVQQQAPAAEPQRAAPAAQAQQAPRVREGDLVPAGTEGLNPPRLTRRVSVPYPPMAKQQRVEGTVVTSVLVSETGQVLDVRILRGIARPVGLNEAAEQAMRRSTFTPGTKDGVRVRSWLTVPVEFKL